MGRRAQDAAERQFPTAGAGVPWAVYLFRWRTRMATTRALSATSPAPSGRVCRASARRSCVRHGGFSGALAGMVGVNELTGVHGAWLEFVRRCRLHWDCRLADGAQTIRWASWLPVCCLRLVSKAVPKWRLMRGFSRDMVVMLQGFIVLFSGAMAAVIARPGSRA